MNGKPGGGELVWLEHPADGLNTLPWPEHIITSGPDALFELEPWWGGSWIVYAAEFTNKRLAVYHIGKGGQVLNSRVIDDNLGNAY